MPIHWRCRRSAATQAVAQPQNGSKTRSPSLEQAATIRSKSASGFCVSQSIHSLEAGTTVGMRQTASTLRSVTV